MSPTPSPPQFDPVAYQEVFLEETFKLVEVGRRELLSQDQGARTLATTTEPLTAESCYNVCMCGVCGIEERVHVTINLAPDVTAV